MRRITQSLAACAILSTAGTAMAVPTVVDIVGTTDPTVTHLGGNLYRINIETLTAVSGLNVIRIDCDNTDSIELLSVADLHDTSVPTVISMGVDDADRPNNVQFIGAGVGEIVIDQVRILGNLGNASVNGASVVAREIGSLEVGGDLLKGILIKTVLSGTPRMDSLVVEGDMLASINWEPSLPNNGDGEIGSIVVRGTIGTAANDRVSVRAPRGIEVFEGEGDIYADVLAVITGYSPATIGVIRSVGSFTGVIEAKSFANTTLDAFTGLDINGDLISASSSIPVLLLDDPLESDHFIRIGGDFGSASITTVIELPANGLEGQISVNAEDTSNIWYGSVKVGSTTYSEGYSALPSVIGGGAAGKAPFTMHESTASPATPHYVFITGIDILDPMMECYEIPFDDEISFRLYGPASIESGTGTPAKVQINSSGWTDDFDIDAEIVSSTGSRGLKFVRKSGGTPIAWPQVFGEYRIVPKADRIVSVDVTGEPTVEFEYYIELLDGCGLMLLENYDLNTDDDVCMEDMGWWLDTPVDLNGDEDADSADAALLLRAIDIYQNR